MQNNLSIYFYIFKTLKDVSCKIERCALPCKQNTRNLHRQVYIIFRFYSNAHAAIQFTFQNQQKLEIKKNVCSIDSNISKSYYNYCFHPIYSRKYHFKTQHIFLTIIYWKISFYFVFLQSFVSRAESRIQ